MFAEQGSGERGELVFSLSSGRSLESGAFAKLGWIEFIKVTRVLLGTVEDPLMREVSAERGIRNALFWDNWKMPASGVE